MWAPHEVQAQQWYEVALKVVRPLLDHRRAHEDQQGLPSVSAEGMQAVGDVIWAVYKLRETWKSLGPRVETVKHVAAAPGRNDPCACGSEKKFNKCCG